MLLWLAQKKTRCPFSIWNVRKKMALTTLRSRRSNSRAYYYLPILSCMISDHMAHYSEKEENKSNSLITYLKLRYDKNVAKDRLLMYTF